jgi:hypothetical protein
MSTAIQNSATLTRWSSIERHAWIVVMAANAFLVAVVLNSPHHAVYDEGIYLDAIKLLETEGFSRQFLLSYIGPAGPLHAVFYFPFIKLGIAFPYLRLLSFALLLASAWMLSRVAVASALSADISVRLSPGLIGAIFTAIPTAAVSGGMTLTEMPAMLFFNGSLLLLVLSRRSLSLGISLGSASAAGFLFGIAVLGRQNYLVLLPLVAMVLIADERNRTANICFVATFCGITLATVAPVFLVWGGLVPPTTASLGEGLSWWNAVLSLGYGGLIGFVVAPEIARTDRLTLVLATIAAVAVWMVAGTRMLPMQTALTHLLGPSGVELVGYAFGLLVSAIASYFLLCFAAHLISNYDNRPAFIFGISLVCGLLSNVKITHQFSSRYVFVFAPLLLLSLAPALRPTWHLPLRIAVGAAIGLISAVSYLSLAASGACQAPRQF